MNAKRYLTASELSEFLPFSPDYIRAAMNHEDFETIGNRPAFATLEVAETFFKNHTEFRIRMVYRKKSTRIREL